MASTLFVVVVFVVLLALLPVGVKWLQARREGELLSGANSKIVSVVAVGPSQRVVVLETGPAHERVWLTLGVTAQSVRCLHTAAASPVISTPASGEAAQAEALT